MFVLKESTLIWNRTTVINIEAETIREQTEQIGVDMDELERRLRQLEQQADEDERLAREVSFVQPQYFSLSQILPTCQIGLRLSLFTYTVFRE